MGGEVSYFVKLVDDQVIHVINFVKRDPYRRGEGGLCSGGPVPLQIIEIIK